MQVKVGPLKYEWLEDWAKTPDIPSNRQNGRTHGVVAARNGKIYVFHQSKPALLVFDNKGSLVDSVSHDFPAAHGLTLVSEGRNDFLWLTDQDSGLVGKVTLDGKIIQTIEKPDHPVYKSAKYAPTWVAVHPKSGDIYVTDGYGSNYIHRYAKNGSYIASFNGSESAAGAFSCPHAIYFDVRGRKEPELYVADRANKRIQVFDGEGKYKRVFGSDFLIHPCAFAAHGEFLFVPELFGRMAVIDGKRLA